MHRIDFGAEFRDDLAVHRDTALVDDPFAGTPRGHSRFREKFLQANHEVNSEGRMLNDELETSTFVICNSSLPSGLRLCLAQAGDAVAGFPLAAFLEQGDALEALEDVTIGAGGTGRAQAAML